MANERQSDTDSGVKGGADLPGGMPDHSDTSPGVDIGQPTFGSGGVKPEPNPSGIPGGSRAGEGEDKGDLAPGPDRILNDIKNGSR